MKWLRELDEVDFFKVAVIVVGAMFVIFVSSSIMADKMTECYYIDTDGKYTTAIKSFIRWENDSVIYRSQNIDDVLRVYNQLEHCSK